MKLTQLRVSEMTLSLRKKASGSTSLPTVKLLQSETLERLTCWDVASIVCAPLVQLYTSQLADLLRTTLVRAVTADICPDPGSQHHRASRWHSNVRYDPVSVHTLRILRYKSICTFELISKASVTYQWTLIRRLLGVKNLLFSGWVTPPSNAPSYKSMSWHLGSWLDDASPVFKLIGSTLASVAVLANQVLMRWSLRTSDSFPSCRFL